MKLGNGGLDSLSSFQQEKRLSIPSHPVSTTTTKFKVRGIEPRCILKIKFQVLFEEIFRQVSEEGGTEMFVNCWTIMVGLMVIQGYQHG